MQTPQRLAVALGEQPAGVYGSTAQRSLLCARLASGTALTDAGHRDARPRAGHVCLRLLPSTERIGTARERASGRAPGCLHRLAGGRHESGARRSAWHGGPYLPADLRREVAANVGDADLAAAAEYFSGHLQQLRIVHPLPRETWS